MKHSLKTIFIGLGIAGSPALILADLPPRESPILENVSISSGGEVFQEAAEDVYDEFKELYWIVSNTSHPKVYSGFRTFGDFEGEKYEKVIKEFEEFRGEVLEIALKAATKAEGRNRLIASRKPALSKVDKAKLRTFADGVRSANISIRSHAYTIKLFYHINAMLGKDARAAAMDPQKQLTLYAVQALFVSEMSTVIKRSIENLKLHGVEPFLDLYTAEIKEVNAIIERMNSLVAASNPESERAMAEINIQSWNAALRPMIENWELLMDALRTQKLWIDASHANYQEFERKGEHAEIQMDVLERGAEVSGVDRTLKDVERIQALDIVPFIQVDQDFAYETLGFGDLRPQTTLNPDR